MWKTFQDFLWPHSNLQIKEMWALLQNIVILQPQESFPVVSMDLLPLSTAWVPFTFDSLVYRSFSWNFIWQHPAFYKLAECRHIFKKNFVVKFIRERHYTLLQRNQTCQGASTSFHQKWRPLLKRTYCELEKIYSMYFEENRKGWSTSSLPWFEPFFPEEIKPKTMYVWRCHLENQFCSLCLFDVLCLTGPAFPCG